MSIDKPIGRAALRAIITIFSSISEEASRGRTLIGGIEQEIGGFGAAIPGEAVDHGVLGPDRAVSSTARWAAPASISSWGPCDFGLGILKGVALQDDRRVRVVVDPLAAGMADAGAVAIGRP
jgi:hypothetical protein